MYCGVQRNKYGRNINQDLPQPKSRLQELEIEVQTLKQNNQLLLQERNKAHDELIAAQEETNRLLDWLNDSQREADALRATLSQKQQHYQTLKCQNEDISKLLIFEQQQKQDYLIKARQIKQELQSQISKLQHQKCQAQQNLSTTKKEVSDLQSKIEQLSFEKDKAMIHMEEKTKEWERIGRHKELVINQLRHQIDRLIKELTSKQREVNELKINNMQLSAKHSESDINSPNTDAQETIRQLYDRISVLTEERDEFYLIKKQFASERERIFSEINSLIKQKEEWEIRENQLKQKIQMITKERDQFAIELTQLEAKGLQNQDRSFQLKKSEDAKLTQVIKNLEQKVTRLEINIKILKSENEMIKHKNSLLEYELEEELLTKSVQQKQKNESIFIVGVQDSSLSMI